MNIVITGPRNGSDNRLSLTESRIIEQKAATAAATSNSYLIGMSGLIPTDIGTSNQYLPEIISSDKIKGYRYGESVVVCGQTGSGKSSTIVKYSANKSPDEKVLVLTPRRCTKGQLCNEVAKELCIPPDRAGELLKKMNVDIMTYQSFVKVQNQFRDKKLTVFLDECHCLSSDATFAMYAQLMLQWLKNNLDNTKRVYLSATIDTVLPLMWSIEYLNDDPDNTYYPSPSSDIILHATPEESIRYNLGRFTRIKRLILMKPNWDYISFKFYNPNATEKLAAYVNTDKTMNCKINDYKIEKTYLATRTAASYNDSAASGLPENMVFTIYKLTVERYGSGEIFEMYYRTEVGNVLFEEGKMLISDEEVKVQFAGSADELIPDKMYWKITEVK